MNKELHNPVDPSEELPLEETEEIEATKTPLTEFEKEQQDVATRRSRWRRERKEKKQVEELPLEKGDYLAMVIAAFLTFGPIFLALTLVILFVSWFFLR